MLSLQIIREQRDRVIESLGKRRFKNAGSLIDEVIELDQKRRDVQLRNDGILSESNTLAKEIGLLMKTGKKEEAEKVKSKTSELKKQSTELSAELAALESELQQLLYSIPNTPDEKVPAGSGSEDNITIHEHGALPQLPESAQPHWDLIKKYDIIDFDLGNKISGAGFPVYKGKGAKLQRALINFFLDQATAQGYKEIQPPLVVNEASGYGTGQLPDKEGQMYHVTADNLFLIPTAEVPITNLYRDMILSDSEIPTRNVGYTPCFRREAGSWGAHVRGLNRLHQFDKVEIVQIRKPDESARALDEMCAYVQSLLELLELPYRKLLLCGGDMGVNASITYDMEVWAGAQKRWLEVSSVSNFGSYQANRMKLRFKDEQGKTQLLHTLNGSALALPRIVAALLENNQTNEGIRIPKVLVPYTKFDIIG
ncbi:MAG: serine--tRNA ligase [Flammeovirgaceae bacterium]|nr:serine--tRNA ligase [Flammeovirgaceae bacterium]